MEKYSTLRSAIYRLNLVPDGDIDTELAKMIFESKLARLSESERTQFLLEIRMELEQALADPDIDWVKFSEEARFTFTLPNDISWFWNYPDGVINELKAVLYDFIYPERIITKQDLIRVERVAFFLMFECQNEYEYVSFEAILRQLRTMKQHWLNLEYFHLSILLTNYFFITTYNYAEFRKTTMSLPRDKKELEKPWIDSYKYAPENSSYNPYEGWPPFSTDPSHPFYLKYDRESWLEILRNCTES